MNRPTRHLARISRRHRRLSRPGTSSLPAPTIAPGPHPDPFNITSRPCPPSSPRVPNPWPREGRISAANRLITPITQSDATTGQCPAPALAAEQGVWRGRPPVVASEGTTPRWSADDDQPRPRGEAMPRDDDVRGRLARHVLTDGFHIILDLRRSCGSWIVDARDGRALSGPVLVLRLRPRWASTRPGSPVTRSSWRCSPRRRRTSPPTPTSTPRTTPTSSTRSPGCWAIRRCRTCSSSRAGRWPSRTRSSARSTGRAAATRWPAGRPSWGRRSST